MAGEYRAGDGAWSRKQTPVAVSSGELAIDSSWIVVSAESGSTDTITSFSINLTWLATALGDNGTSAEYTVMLQATSGHTITIQHNTSNNIYCENEQSVVLTDSLWTMVSIRKNGATISGYVKQAISPMQFSQTADVAVANTVTETTLIGAGQGNATIAADALGDGAVIKVTAGGHLSNTGTPTLELRLDLGGTTVLDTGAVTTASGLSSDGWRLEAEITVRTDGASGTARGNGYYLLKDVLGVLPDTSDTTVDTTGTLAVDLTAEWGTASASNTITCTNLSIEIKR